jgi:predicted glycosyltransferase
MAGGGEDGYELLRAVLEALRVGRNGCGFEPVLVGGPLMPPHHRAEVLEHARDRSIRYIDFVDDVASYVEAADVVVSMGGYNSVCELLSLRTPALIVPRVWPRREQLMRAQALSQFDLLHWLDPSELAPGRLLREMSRLLDDPPRPARLAMNGLAAAADAVDELLEVAPADAPLARAGGRHG